jgi:hypothetical protein
VPKAGSLERPLGLLLVMLAPQQFIHLVHGIAQFSLTAQAFEIARPFFVGGAAEYLGSLNAKSMFHENIHSLSTAQDEGAVAVTLRTSISKATGLRGRLEF